MTSAPPFPPETTHQGEPPFWRDLLETTLGYMKWGYACLGLSCAAYGLYLVAQMVAAAYSFNHSATISLLVTGLLCLNLSYFAWRYRHITREKELARRIDAVMHTREYEQMMKLMESLSNDRNEMKQLSAKIQSSPEWQEMKRVLDTTQFRSDVKQVAMLQVLWKKVA